MPKNVAPRISIGPNWKTFVIWRELFLGSAFLRYSTKGSCSILDAWRTSLEHERHEQISNCLYE
jgi:hypothetical protein